MEEIHAAKGSRDKWVDLSSSTGNLQCGAATDVGEDITLAQLDESQLRVVTMRKEI